LEIAFNRKVKINFISKIIRRPITIMMHTYWQIGKRIVEQEQQGNSRASYGDFVVSGLSKYLSDALGKGFFRSQFTECGIFTRPSPTSTNPLRSA